MPTSKESPHVLVFPYPAQGHILPALDLVHQLVIHGVTITVLVTPNNLPIVAPLLSAHPSIQSLVFPFPRHPSIPPGVENVKDLGNAGNSLIISALSNLHDQIVSWFRSHPTPPVAIISDFFLGWTHDLANHVGVPRLAFYSSGALLALVLDHIWENFESLRCLDLVEFSEFPRSPRFAMEQLPSVFRRYRESDPDWEVVRSGMVANGLSWGFVFNTFDGLESEYLDYFKKLVGHRRVFAVGPINLLDGPGRAPDPSPSTGSGAGVGGGVLSWLDGCDDGSVLYVCFGSQKLLKQAQMDALANGLQQSGVKFVWVVKPATAQQLEEGYGLVPNGLEARVGSRGFVIKGWAPQVAILSHRAIGGFLSHCGWNSILEAVVAGVMILGWPMEADQFVNARQLVDYVGTAVRVCEGGDTVPDSAHLARTISESMKDDIIEKVRTMELREKALEAIKVGGSSAKDLEDLVTQLGQLQQTNIP